MRARGTRRCRDPAGHRGRDRYHRVGLACGIAAAVAAGSGLRALFDSLAVTDPVALGGAGSVLMVVCLAAAAIPAIRAVRMNAAAALRHE